MASAFQKCLPALLWLLLVLAAAARSSVVDVKINESSSSFHKVDEKFMSITIDIWHSRNHFEDIPLSNNPTLVNLAKVFSPGLLRIGGTAAENVLFDPSSVQGMHGGRKSSCKGCREQLPPSEWNMTAKDWETLNTFAAQTDLQLVFDLNDELRKGGSWDPSNAEELLKVTAEKKYGPLWWQLGNEPNWYPIHNWTIVSATQLAKDLHILRNLLARYPSVGGTVLGPEVTKPKPETDDIVTGDFQGGLPTIPYMEDFLKGIAAQGGSAISYVTWHHYYLNGEKAGPWDLLDPATYDLFINRTTIYRNLVNKYLPGKPMALSETGLVLKAGGYLSESLPGAFLWLDALGVAAALQQQFVCKQSLLGGQNGLLNNMFQPFPLYWVSVLHKQLMGAGVLEVEGGLELKRTARVYAHCTAQPSHAQRRVPSYQAGAVTLSVVNLRNESITIATNFLSGSKDLYLLHGTKNLTSPNFYLNDVYFPLRSISSLPSFKPDQLSAQDPVVFPPLSCGFVVFGQAKWPTCI